MANNNDNKKPNQPKKPGNSGVFSLLTAAVIITLLIQLFVKGSFFEGSLQIEITYNDFIKLVDTELIERVELKENRYLIYMQKGTLKGQVNAAIDYQGREIRAVIEQFKELDLTAESEEPYLLKTARNFIKNDFIARFPALIIKMVMDSSVSADNIVYYTGQLDNPELINMLLERNVEVLKPQVQNNYFYSVVELILPIFAIYIVFMLVMRNMSKRMGGGGFMNVGKSNAKMYNMEKKTGITFDDVAGQEEAKESLTEIVDFLHHPEKYAAIGAKQPKGALLVGPPGTGKTLLAKAVAGEAKVPFFSLTGSEFVEMYVGVGASRVRDLFKLANQHAPCIIFIDEIDAIGKSRDNQLNSNDEREQTLNQLLSEMDGFDTSKGIVILAATNRPEILDKALLRPGRFDRRVIVEKPDLIGREAILQVHAKKVKMDGDVNLKQIALATSGAAGADLANMINEAALRAVRLNRDMVKQEDLMEAVEVVIAGKEKKDRIMSAKEKRLVAFHEVGHAMTAAFEKNAQPVQKITIVPRTMGSLGYVMQMPEEEKFLMTKEEFISEITVFLGGRAAEVIMFNTQTTGASNDIERATAMARSMVTQYGMSDKFGIMGLERIQSRYLDGKPVTTCSPKSEADIDLEVKKILDTCYEKALSVISSHKETITQIAEFLLSKENISGEEFMKILKELNPDFIEKKPDESINKKEQENIQEETKENNGFFEQGE